MDNKSLVDDSCLHLGENDSPFLLYNAKRKPRWWQTDQEKNMLAKTTTLQLCQSEGTESGEKMSVLDQD